MNTITLKVCSIHGETEFRLRSDNGWRCLKCRNEAVIKRRRKLKVMAVQYLGGKCIRCGYNKCIEALDFHHNNGDKDFGISSKGLTRSWSKLQEELDKCIILCANCHREEHAAG